MISSMTAREKDFHYPGEEIVIKTPSTRELEGVSKQAFTTGRGRLWVTASVFALAFSVIGMRLVDLMVIEADAKRIAASRAAAEAISTTRSDIVDRNGVVIATNLPTVNLYANPAQVLDPMATAQRLLDVLPGADKDVLLRRLTSDARFVYLSRNLTPRTQSVVNSLGLPGVHFEEAERRVYPQGPLFAHILGGTNTDNDGLAGIELGLNGRLQRADGPVPLTLDSRVQHAVRDVLTTAVSRFQAKAAVGLVLDVKEGDVLSLVSLPDFSPGALGQAPDEARFNRATFGLYEMGSTFKLFTVAMGLDSGRVQLTDGYDATDALEVSGFTINDFHAEERWLSIPELLIHSSNIASGKLALDIGTSTQQDYLRRLGLLEPSDIVLPETSTPRYPSRWADVHTVTISYGHGISVTPLQVAAATAAVVNGGVEVRPRLVSDMVNPWADEREQVFRPQTSETMRALMRLVVLEGSGKQADVPGYAVGGKTESAEKIDAETGAYMDDVVRTSFVAAFPILDPKYVVFVLLDEPQGLKETFNFATAGWNAAPTTGAIIRRIAPMLGVYPSQDHTTSDPSIRDLIPVSAAGSAEGDVYAAR